MVFSTEVFLLVGLTSEALALVGVFFLRPPAHGRRGLVQINTCTRRGSLVQKPADGSHRRPVVQAGPLCRLGFRPVQKTARKTSLFTCASACMGMSVLELFFLPILLNGW